LMWAGRANPESFRLGYCEGVADTFHNFFQKIIAKHEEHPFVLESSQAICEVIEQVFHKHGVMNCILKDHGGRVTLTVPCIDLQGLKARLCCQDTPESHPAEGSDGCFAGGSVGCEVKASLQGGHEDDETKVSRFQCTY